MTKKQILPQEKLLTIEKVSSHLRKKKNIIFAYIFGSYARNEKFTDVDVGIYINKKKIQDNMTLEFKLEEEIKSLINFPVDVRIINHAPLSFVYQLIKEGILIVDRDISKRTDFEGIIFKKHFDFARFQKQYLKEVVDAPV